MSDQTSLERAEAALRRVEAQLRSVVNHSSIIIWALDADGVFTLSEGAGLASLGLAPGEVVGRSVFEVYETAGRERAIANAIPWAR